MKRFLNDVSNTLYSYFILTTIILSFLFWIAQLLRYINFITDINLNALTALKISLLLIPEILTVIFPISFTVAVGVTYVIFIRTNQITAAFSSGTSYYLMLRPVLKIGRRLGIILCLLSFYISPMSLHKFYSFKKEFSNAFTIPSANNVINYQNVSFFIGGKKDNNQISNVIIHDKRNNKLSTLIADSAKIGMNANKIYVELTDGSKVSVRNNKFNKLSFKNYKTSISKKKIINDKTYNEKCIQELLKSKDNKEVVMAHQKIISPIILILNGLLLSIFILTMDFTRRFNFKPFVYIIGCITLFQSFNLLIMKLAIIFPIANLLFYLVYIYLYIRIRRYIQSL